MVIPDVGEGQQGWRPEVPSARLQQAPLRRLQCCNALLVRQVESIEGSAERVRHQLAFEIQASFQGHHHSSVYSLFRRARGELAFLTGLGEPRL